jgi:thioredoxin-like negative regulator of GroEL
MLTLSQDPLKLMSLIGALCSDLMAHEQALSIFRQLALLRDDDPNALVSWAVAQSRSGDEAGAMSTLKRALAEDPAHDMARVMLAIHLHRAGDLSARVLLGAVLSDGRDGDALALAASVRDEVLNVTVPSERVLRHRYTRVCVN